MRRERQRIAIVVPGGVDRGGERRVIPVLLALFERLAARHEVEVFALAQYREPCQYRLLGAHVTNLGRPRSLVGVPGRVRHWRLRALTTALRTNRFDLIHAFWATEPGWLATAAAARLALPSVLSLAGGELAGLPDIGYGAQLSWRTRLRVAQALRRATVVTCASGPMAGAARSWGVDPLIVPLGVPPVAAAWEPASGAERLLFVGSLNLVKDPFTLLAAFRRVRAARPGVTLDVVGEDTLDGAVQRRAAELGLTGSVRFHGFLPQPLVHALYEASSLLIVSSRHEAGPVVALEAASHGLPMVGTHVGHLADGAGEWAVTVAVGDAPGLAGAVSALLADPERRTRMGRAAHAWALANDADTTAARFEAVYRRLMRAPDI